MFAELWVTFFQTCAELWFQFFWNHNSKMARPRPKLGEVTTIFITIGIPQNLIFLKIKMADIYN